MKPIVTLKKHCAQDWEKMKSVEGGHFCDECQKCVIDFTQFTDLQLANYLLKAEQRPCGKYREDQLNRWLVSNPTGIKQRVAGAFLSLSIAFGLKQNMPPLNMIQHRPVEIFNGAYSDSSPAFVSVTSDPDSLYIISGIVKDYVTRKPIQNAKIIFGVIEIEALTDKEGQYQIVIPEKFRNREIPMTIEKEKYKSVQFFIGPSDLPFSQEILLIPVQFREVHVFGY